MYNTEQAKARIAEIVGDCRIDWKWYCVEDGEEFTDRQCKGIADDILADRFERTASVSDFDPIY